MFHIAPSRADLGPLMSSRYRSRKLLHCRARRAIYYPVWCLCGALIDSDSEQCRRRLSGKLILPASLSKPVFVWLAEANPLQMHTQRPCTCAACSQKLQAILWCVCVWLQTSEPPRTVVCPFDPPVGLICRSFWSPRICQWVSMLLVPPCRRHLYQRFTQRCSTWACW